MIDAISVAAQMVDSTACEAPGRRMGCSRRRERPQGRLDEACSRAIVASGAAQTSPRAAQVMESIISATMRLEVRVVVGEIVLAGVAFCDVVEIVDVRWMRGRLERRQAGVADRRRRQAMAQACVIR